MLSKSLLREIIDSLLNYHQNAFIILLICEDLLDIFDEDERERIVNTYLPDELIITLNQSIKIEYFPNTRGDFKIYLNRLLKYENLGIKFFMKLLLLENTNFLTEELLSFLVSNIKDQENSKKLIALIRNEIIEYFTELDYEKLRLFFISDDCGYSLIEFLQEEDILRISKNPNSHFLEKLEKIINTFISCPCEIEDILLLLGEDGIPLLFKCIRREEWGVGGNIFDHFRAMGKKFIKPFLKEVIFSRYWYGDLVEELYRIFLGSMTTTELEEFVKNNNYEFIKNLVEQYENSESGHSITVYFIAMLFYRLGISEEDIEYELLNERMKKTVSQELREPWNLE